MIYGKCYHKLLFKRVIILNLTLFYIMFNSNLNVKNVLYISWLDNLRIKMLNRKENLTFNLALKCKPLIF